MKELNDRLVLFGLTNTQLEIRQDPKDKNDEYLNEVTLQNKELMEKDILINKLKKELDMFKMEDQEALREINILFPELKNVSFGKHLLHPNTDSSKVMTVVLYQSDHLSNQNILKIEQWLGEKFHTRDLVLVRQ